MLLLISALVSSLHLFHASIHYSWNCHEGVKIVTMMMMNHDDDDDDDDDDK